MVDKRNSYLLLFAILLAGFIYRFLIMTWNVFPPGADIGLHESVIDSILAPKSTFLYNYYHMAGGISVTNPGYHIFAAFIITMTGAPDYLVQAAVASLFSTLIIVCIFMVAKLVWGERVGFIAAILATFSVSDILMLSWAGYPNIIALAFIPLLFYLFLQPKRLSAPGYIITASLVMGALFLTHLFSAIVFLAIALFSLLVSIAFSKSTGFTGRTAISWFLPIFFGFILVSPYLLSVTPIYFGSEGAITGSVAVMKQAVVETRLVSTVISVLALVPLFLFLFISKNLTGKIFSLPSILFGSSILIPLAASQCYLLGFFLDYERFLYFLALPVIVCLAFIVVKLTEIISRVLSRNWARFSSVRVKTVLLSVLVITCLVTPLFALPNVGLAQASFFQVMNPVKYEAIEWIKENTPSDSVCVADAEFGWWLSGFGQRRTLSAVDPQYLILQREFEPAIVASNLLKADYLVENGLLQVEQAGAFANGSTHEIYAVLDTSVYRPLVFALNDTQISLLYRYDGTPMETKLGTFLDSNTHVANDSDSTSFIISRESELFRVTEEITIFQGVRFAEVTFVFQNEGSVNFDWLRIPFQSRGELIQYANSIGIVDSTLQVVNQIVFSENELGKDVMMQENPDFYELIFNLKGTSTAKVSFFVGLCPFNANSQTGQTEFYNSLMEVNSKTYLDIVSDEHINCFDYRAAIRKWNISYIAICDQNILPSFSGDPTYELAFKNSEVMIFRVVGA